MGSSVRYTRPKMKLLALIAASATAFDSIVKDDANRNSNPGGFSLSEGITIKGDGSCPKCEDEASLAACIVVDKFETCETRRALRESRSRVPFESPHLALNVCWMRFQSASIV